MKPDKRVWEFNLNAEHRFGPNGIVPMDYPNLLPVVPASELERVQMLLNEAVYILKCVAGEYPDTAFDAREFLSKLQSESGK